MLVLSRKVGERVVIGRSIVVTVLAAHGRTVKIGIAAPPDVEVFRRELVAEHDVADEADGELRRIARPRGLTQDGSTYP
ncbi:MAG: carbon storage regulator [Isosphaeraceae bacterium]